MNGKQIEIEELRKSPENQISDPDNADKCAEEQVTISDSLTTNPGQAAMLASLQSENSLLRTSLDGLTKERDQMLKALQNNQETDSSAFDLYKLNKLKEDNKELLKQIEDLRFELLAEKGLN